MRSSSVRISRKIAIAGTAQDEVKSIMPRQVSRIRTYPKPDILAAHHGHQARRRPLAQGVVARFFELPPFLSLTGYYIADKTHATGGIFRSKPNSCVRFAGVGPVAAMGATDPHRASRMPCKKRAHSPTEQTTTLAAKRG